MNFIVENIYLWKFCSAGGQRVNALMRIQYLLFGILYMYDEWEGTDRGFGAQDGAAAAATAAKIVACRKICR